MTESKKSGNSTLEPSTSLIIRALLFIPGAYLVLLLSASITVGIGVGFIYGIISIYEKLNLNSVPSGIILLLFIGILIGIYAVFKGIIRSFWKKPKFESAILIDLNIEKTLKSFISALCIKMNTQMPDAVLLHSHANFFVTHGKLNVINARVKGRVVSIGAPALNCLSINELRAILAHEFAHFTGKDTLYSSLVLPIYVSIITASEEMGAIIYDSRNNNESFYIAVPLMIPNLALKLYLKSFHTLNMKISRLREERADKIATNTCGYESFSQGLKLTTGISKLFDYLSKKQIVELLKQEQMYINYYNEFRRFLFQNPDWDIKYSNWILDQIEDKYASHPTTRLRLEYISKKEEQFADNEPSVTLFENLISYEEKLTNYYTELIANIMLKPV